MMRAVTVAITIPTEHLALLERYNPPIGKFRVAHKRLTMDFKAI